MQGALPYQNALIETIDGILKHEFGLIRKFKNIHVLGEDVAEAIYIYNTQRLHIFGLFNLTYCSS